MVPLTWQHGNRQLGLLLVFAQLWGMKRDSQVSLSQVQQVTGENRAEEEEEEETYLRKALLPAFSFVVGHLDDLADLLDEGLALTLQNELTLHLKHRSTSSSITQRPGFKEKTK